MRPRIALLDGALGDSLLARCRSAMSPEWSIALLPEDTGADYPQYLSLIIPHSKSQTCNCPTYCCIRDAVVAHLPDRALVVSVLVRPSLLCVAECSDMVFVPDVLAQQWKTKSIPLIHAPTNELVCKRFCATVMRGMITTRHRAQLYRRHLAEVE